MSLPVFLFIFGLMNWLIPLCVLIKFIMENDIDNISDGDIIMWMLQNFSFQQIMNLKAFSMSGAAFIFISIALGVST